MDGRAAAQCALNWINILFLPRVVLRMTPLCIVERVVVLVMELPKKRLSTQGGFETQIQTLSGLQAGQQAKWW